MFAFELDGMPVFCAKVHQTMKGTEKQIKRRSYYRYSQVQTVAQGLWYYYFPTLYTVFCRSFYRVKRQKCKNSNERSHGTPQKRETNDLIILVLS